MKTSLVIAALPAFLLAFAHDAKADQVLKVLATPQGLACRDSSGHELQPKTLPPKPPFDARSEAHNKVVPVNQSDCYLDRGDVRLNESLACPDDTKSPSGKLAGTRGCTD
jgi:hypothetical protein